MVTPANTITHSAGYVAFASAVNQVDQFQEMCFRLYTICAAMGTIEQTCNGAAVNTSGSNISTQAHMVHGTAAAQAHTWWIVLIGDQRWLFELTRTTAAYAAVTTPTVIRLYKATAAYNTDGSTTTKPTIGTVSRENAAIDMTIIEHTGAVAAGIFWWYSSNGQFILAQKRTGDAVYRAGLALFRGGVDGDSETGYASHMFYLSNGAGIFTAALLGSSTNFTSSGSLASGLTMTAGFLASPIWTISTSWTNGQAASRGKFREITFGSVASGSGGRYFGVIEDVRACAQNTPFNAEDSAETGTHRLRTIGTGIAVPLLIGTADV